jgi:AcrR family transcriptional regulator
MAALELFKKISFEKTSVSDIASACGMGKGTFYLYFKSKDEIFASLLEERLDMATKRFESFYKNPHVTVHDKIRQYFDNIVDDYFLIKDLLFGSFEKVKGRMIKDVFFKYGKYYLQSVDVLQSIIEENADGIEYEGLHEKLVELMDLILGRMLVYVMVHDWDDREGLKKTISPLSVRLFDALVA